MLDKSNASIEKLNTNIKKLDLAMAKLTKRIIMRKVPDKKDLDTLLSFYQMTLKIYSSNDTIYRINPLMYTNLSEVECILNSFGYLNSKTNSKSNSHIK